MANTKRKKNGKGAKRPALRYFFINDELHKKLTINRGQDLLTAWNYARGKKVSYTYSDVVKRYERAWSTKEVSEMLNRIPVVLEKAFKNGMIERPQFTYGIDENRRLYQYMWSEKDIFAALAYFATLHQGRPRKDGGVTPKHLPTPRELRAMIHDEEFLYVKQGDTFVPTWRAKNI